MNVFMTIIIDFRSSAWVTVNFLCVNGLNWDFSFLVKRARIEWETMSTLGLANLGNQLACTLHEPPRSKTAKIFSFQP